MRRLLITAAISAMAVLAVPALASASPGDGYWISQRQAEHDVRDAAETRYAGNGVTADTGVCKPQGAKSFRRVGGYWHRWTCYWEGLDEDGAKVDGFFRITGHTDGRFGYLPVFGGMHWE